MSGPGISLKFQSNYRTFSPAQFMAAFNGKGFVGTQVTAQVSVNRGRAAVTSIRLSLIRSRDELLTVVIEPFGNDPEWTYYVDVQYATKVAKKFNAFMEKAGKSMIDDIVKGVEHDG